jgi:NTP pyrophosphatase (non-canonical NTP hydrolase)
MELNEYQQCALRTWIGKEKFVRSFLGVCGEAGELSENLNKYLREDYDEAELKRRAFKELGDVLYYLSVTAHELGFSLEEIAAANVEKLAKRMAEGKIRGDGSDR